MKYLNMRFYSLLLFYSVCTTVSAQLTETHLPIVIIHTEGAPIEDEPKTRATIDIIYKGGGAANNISDFPNEYSGLCGIETRGSSSQSFEKKSYSFELWDAGESDLDTSFLGFKKEEDFILNGPYSDKSLINNTLVLQLARDMGHYATKTRFVELILNDAYQGVYVIMEKIKRDKNRVAISKLTEDDISGDALTGGYIIRLDHDRWGGWESKYDKFDNDEKLYFQYVYPKQEDILPAQENYIQKLITELEDAFISNSFANDKNKHYTQYINLRSFVDNFIINELSKNVDAYRLSSYFYKDKDSEGGRIFAGPVWDYNLSLANASYCNCFNPEGWMYYQCKGHSPFWWDRMLTSFTFTTALKCRWEELRSDLLSEENLLALIDSRVEELGDAVDRNFERWPILDEWVWPNSDLFGEVESHTEVIDKMKDWLVARLAWMDENMPGDAAICELFEDPDFEISTAVEDHEQEKMNLQLYPNPSTGQLHVEANETIQKLALYNNLGQKVYELNGANRTSIELDLTTLPGVGSYHLRAVSYSGSYTRSFVYFR